MNSKPGKAAKNGAAATMAVLRSTARVIAILKDKGKK